MGQDTAYAIWAHMEEAFSEWISCSAHFTISLLLLLEAWWQAVATSDHRRLRSRADNPAPSIPVVTAGESDSSVQLVGSGPQQAGRSSTVKEMAKARLAACAGAVRPRRWPPNSQCTVVGGGGLPPSSADRGALDSNGYSTASETAGHRCQCRGHRGSREKKRFAPARLDMPMFKLTDPLWRFDVDAFLEQYNEASMCPHIFASLRGYPSKWARTLDEGKDICAGPADAHGEDVW